MLKKYLLTAIFASTLLLGCNNKAGIYCLVKFESNGGSPVESVRVLKGHRLDKPSDPVDKYADFSMWCNEERLATPYDFSLPVLSDMTLYAKWKNYHFIVSPGELENLTVTGIEGEPLEEVHAFENKDLTLKLQAADGSYISPFMDIKVNGAKLDQDCYLVDIDSDFKSADLKIYGENIHGDIVISGKAVGVLENQYVSVVPACYGLECDSRYQVSNRDSEQTFTFTATDGYDLPNIENVLIKIDNQGVWFHPTSNDSSNEDVAKFIYKKENDIVTLTVKPNGQNITYVDIRLRAPTYNLLDKLSWAQIERISNSNRAEEYFYIGDVKHILVNNQEHAIRIIGFNHDELAGSHGQFAGITFEFETIVSNDDGGHINYRCWTEYGDSRDFEHSTLNSQLNDGQGSVLNMLPIALKQAIKTVNKTFTKDRDKADYNTNLFVLSMAELNGKPEVGKDVYVNDGSKVYSFYENVDNENTRHKYDVNGTECPYWTRTPSKNDDDSGAWLTKEGGFLSVEVGRSSGYPDIGIAPAFCV